MDRVDQVNYLYQLAKYSATFCSFRRQHLEIRNDCPDDADIQREAQVCEKISAEFLQLMKDSQLPGKLNEETIQRAMLLVNELGFSLLKIQ